MHDSLLSIFLLWQDIQLQNRQVAMGLYLINKVFGEQHQKASVNALQWVSDSV